MFLSDTERLQINTDLPLPDALHHDLTCCVHLASIIMYSSSSKFNLYILNMFPKKKPILLIKFTASGKNSDIKKRKKKVKQSLTLSTAVFGKGQ